MKPFNLEEALAGKLCVTRDGRKVKIIFDRRTLEDTEEVKTYPIMGYLQFKDGSWSSFLETWTSDGIYLISSTSKEGHFLDLVGMWEEPQPEVTITIPAPIKEAKEGQEVWYFGFNPTEYLLNPQCDHIYIMAFKSKIFFHQYLLETGQLFATKEDVEAFLEALKGARR